MATTPNQVMTAIVNDKNEEQALSLLERLPKEEKSVYSLSQSWPAPWHQSYLSAAIEQKMPKLVEELLRLNQHAILQRIKHMLPIEFAAKTSTGAIVKILHQEGAKYGAPLTATVLDIALNQANSEMAQFLASLGTPFCRGHIGAAYVRVAEYAELTGDDVLRKMLPVDLPAERNYDAYLKEFTFKYDSTVDLGGLRFPSEPPKSPIPALTILAGRVFMKKFYQPGYLFSSAIQEHNLSLLWFYIQIANLPAHQLIFRQVFSLAVEHQNKSLLLVTYPKLVATCPQSTLDELTHSQTLIAHTDLELLSGQYQCLFQVSLWITQIMNRGGNMLRNTTQDEYLCSKQLEGLQSLLHMLLDDFPKDVSSFHRRMQKIYEIISPKFRYEKNLLQSEKNYMNKIVACLQDSKARVDEHLAAAERQNPRPSLWARLRQ